MKKLIGIIVLLLFFCSSYSAADSGQSTESFSKSQAEIDDEILSKDINDLTKDELKRLKVINQSKTIKRSGYEKRAARYLANDQPKTVEDYEKQSADIKNSELYDFNPKFKKDPSLAKAPEPEFQVVRYNYPAGSREINLSTLKTNRVAKAQGVLSPDYTKIVYSDVNYDPGMRKSSSNVYIIPVKPPETQAQKRAKFLNAKKEILKECNEKLAQDKTLTSVEKKILKDKIKSLTKEIKQLEKTNLEQDKQEVSTPQVETPATLAGKALMQAHIKDQNKTPIMTSGLYDVDYGIQKTLTVVDWSQSGKQLLVKEKILKDGDGLWQTNILVYDFETGKTKKLDEIRQAIEYYWNKNQRIDLYYYRFDLYPLGWDAQHPDRILLYAFGYNKNTGASPKFLGTWSIDYKGEQSHLVSVLKTGYIVQANGFCLRAKNLEYYER